MDGVSINSATFPAGDGWKLAGDIYTGTQPGIAVLISAGTGFPRQFYRNLATYLAERGAIVLTYDYRGIGGSKSENLAESGIEYTDWGRLDMAAALEELTRIAPGLPIGYIGHSVGGHFVGLAPNHGLIRRHVFVAVGSGYWGNHHLSFMPVAQFFWWIIGPVSLWQWGYIKSNFGWQGASLPPNVFRTWRRWCHQPDYFKSELLKGLKPHYFDEVTAPICSWVFSDDPIATEKASSDILGAYPNSPHQTMVRTPSDVGVKRIGHDGAFRPGRERLWNEWFDWLIQ